MYKTTKTKLLEPTREGIKEAIDILRNNGLVALPTETVYGLAANAYSEAAVRKIYLAKNRPEDNPLIWHVHDLPSALKLFSSSMSPLVKKRIEILAANFWPGPLTVIAAKSLNLVSLKHDSLSTIAVRIPDSPLTLKILSELNFPLVMPSANSSTRPSPTSPLHVLKTLDGRIDAVMHGEDCRVGLESSVVRVDENEVTILRPGLIGAKELARVLGENVIEAQDNKKRITLSPGTKYLHYSPKVAEVCLVSPLEASKFWSSNLSILGRHVDIQKISQEHNFRDPEALTLMLGDEPEKFAKELYNALYKAEERPERALIIILPPKDSLWAFVLDRLRKASGDIKMVKGVGL